MSGASLVDYLESAAHFRADFGGWEFERSSVPHRAEDLFS